jgi:hypothetical protein
MKLILMIMAFFMAGLILDIIITRYTKAIADGKKLTASILAMVITIVNFSVMTYVLQNMGDSISGIAAFAGGNGLGTWLAMIKK